MTGLVIALAVAAAIVLLMRLGLALVRRYQARYAAYAEYANEFYAASDRLIDNPDTPDDVIEFVGLMNESINFPHAALVFVRLMQKRRGKRHGDPMFNLRTMPQSMVADFVIAFDSWVNAIASRGMFWGPIFKMYLDAGAIESKAKDVAAISHRRTVATV